MAENTRQQFSLIKPFNAEKMVASYFLLKTSFYRCVKHIESNMGASDIEEIRDRTFAKHKSLNEAFNTKYGKDFIHSLSSHHLELVAGRWFINWHRMSVVQLFEIGTNVCRFIKTKLENKELNLISDSEGCLNAVSFLLNNGNRQEKYFAINYLHKNIKDMVLNWKRGENQKLEEAQALPFASLNDIEFPEALVSNRGTVRQ